MNLITIDGRWLAIIFFSCVILQFCVFSVGIVGAQNGSQFIGKEVVDLQIRCDVPFERKPVNHAISVGLGDIYDPYGIRQSIQMIYYLGIYRDVTVLAEEVEGGVRLIYDLEKKWMVTKFNINGAYSILPLPLLDRSGVRYSDILRRCLVKRGDEFSNERLDRTIADLKALFAEAGYFRCEITPQILMHPESKGVSVTLVIHTGAQARIEDFDIENPTRYTKNFLLRKFKRRQGERYSKKSLLRDIERSNYLLRNAGGKIANGFRMYFQLKKKFRLVRLEYKDVFYDSNTNMVLIKLKASGGDSGLVKYDDKWRWRVLDDNPLDAITFFDNIRLQEEDFDDSAFALREYLIRYHYYNPRVQYRYEKDNANFFDITFRPLELNRIKVKEVELIGNKKISDDTLDDLILSGKGLFGINRFYNQKTLEEDVNNLHNFYLNQGFLDSKVTIGKVKIDEQERIANLSIQIDEGVQTIVESVQIVPDVVLKLKKVIKTQLKPGMPLNYNTIREDENNIFSKYITNGYKDAIIDTQVTFSEDRSKADVTYRVTAGQKYYFGKIIIRGFNLTQRKIIYRELEIREGEPYDLSKVLHSQQRLLSLGIFKTVSIYPIKNQREPQIIDFVVEVKEKNSGSLEFGGGWDSEEGYRGFLTVSHANLGGYDRTISFTYSYSQLETKYQFMFQEPYLGNNPFDSELKLFYINRDEKHYKLSELGSSLNINKRFGEYMKGILEYRYRSQKFLKIEPDFEATYPGELQDIKISSLIPTFLYDRRYNPFNPTKGRVFAISFEQADRILGSETDFAKLMLQTSYYSPWGNDVLAFGYRMGRAFNLPLSEKFKIQPGSTVLRGYSAKDIGPNTTYSYTDDEGNEITKTYTIGGDSMAIFNFEYRYDILGGLWGALFFDSGNIWPEGSQWRLSDFKCSTGFALMYITPIGPVRFDFAWKIEDGHLPFGAWYISIGHPF